MQAQNQISSHHNSTLCNPEIIIFRDLEHTENQHSYFCQNDSSSTGKEKDSETGFYYFGARYYDCDLSGLFLSVDPMADKYPSISPYAYCAWNPIKLVDPYGEEAEDDWYKNNSTQYYTWLDCSVEQEGFTYIGEKGSVLGEYESLVDGILKEYGHEGLYKDGLTLDFAAKDKGALIGSKERGWDFLDEFFNGTGPEISILDGSHPYTQSMQNSNIIQKAQQMIFDGETNIPGQITNVKSGFGLKGLFKAGFSLPKQFIGSFRFDAYTSSNGSSLLNIISDCKSLSSFMYHITPQSWNSQRNGERKAFSNTYQFYIWKTPLK